MWAQLTPVEKEGYQKRGIAEKDRYRKEVEKLHSLGIVMEDDVKRKNENKLELPVAKIRKICRLDPDVRGISKEAVLLVAKAAESFTSKMGEESMRMAQLQNRRTLLTEDLLDVCSMKEPFLFLREDIKDMILEINRTKKTNIKNGPMALTKQIPSVKPITSYFSAKT